MQLDYKDIIIKHYTLSMSGSEIARQIACEFNRLKPIMIRQHLPSTGMLPFYMSKILPFLR
mgnify:CR=1 FL=1